MREFFRGWRRKAGLALLTMACLLMAWWMRSMSAADIGTFAVTAVGRTYSVHSHEGVTEWHVLAGHPIHGHHWWFSCPIINYPHLAMAEQVHLRINRAGQPIYVMAIPHWLIILSLTLLSGWLILGETRKASQTPPSAPD